MKPRPLEAPMKYESEFSTPSSRGEAWIRNVSSLGCEAASFLRSGGEPADDDPMEGRRLPCILDSISIFSSFSSNKSLRSRFSASSTRTRSSSDSV